jgi:hypothetical protein
MNKSMKKKYSELVNDTNERVKLYKNFYTKEQLQERIKDIGENIDTIDYIKFRALEDLVFYKILLNQKSYKQ